MLTEERKKYYIDLIKSCTSLNAVCIKAKISNTTGNYDTLKKLIKEENIDVSHFKRISGQYRSPKKVEEYLIENSSLSTSHMKDKLFKYGLKERKCECCGISEWNGKPLALQLHHINGKNRDNRLENLQILCPNCHTQTDNYGSKNIADRKQSKKNKRKKAEETRIQIIKECLEKGDTENKIAEKLNITLRTLRRFAIKNSIQLLKEEKVVKFNKEKIIELFKEYHSFRAVGKVLGISDNAVRKWCKKYNLPFHIQEMKEYIK